MKNRRIMKSTIKDSVVGIVQKAQSEAQQVVPADVTTEELMDEFKQWSSKKEEQDEEDMKVVVEKTRVLKDPKKIMGAFHASKGTKKQSAVEEVKALKSGCAGPENPTIGDDKSADSICTNPGKAQDPCGPTDKNLGEGSNKSPSGATSDKDSSGGSVPSVGAGSKFPKFLKRRRSLYSDLDCVDARGADMRFLEFTDEQLERFRSGGDDHETDLQLLMINALQDRFLNSRLLNPLFCINDVEWFLPLDVTPVDKLLVYQGAMLAIRIRDNLETLSDPSRLSIVSKEINLGSVRVESTCQKLFKHNFRVMEEHSDAMKKTQESVNALTNATRQLAQASERSYGVMQGMSKEISIMRTDSKLPAKQQALIIPDTPKPICKAQPGPSNCVEPEKEKPVPTKTFEELMRGTKKK